MAAGIEWPLEAFRHVPAVRKPKQLIASAAIRLRPPERQMKKISSSFETPARASDASSRIVKSGSTCPWGKVCHSCVRTRLTQFGEIRQAYESPLCLCADIDQDALRVALEPCPNFVHSHIVDVDNAKTFQTFPNPRR